MKTETAVKLLELSESGYTIHYSSGYVDSSCTINMTDGNEVALSSQVFTGLSLNDLDEQDFTVTEEIDDWQNKVLD